MDNEGMITVVVVMNAASWAKTVGLGVLTHYGISDGAWNVDDRGCLPHGVGVYYYYCNIAAVREDCEVTAAMKSHEISSQWPPI